MVSLSWHLIVRTEQTTEGDILTLITDYVGTEFRIVGSSMKSSLDGLEGEYVSSAYFFAEPESEKEVIALALRAFDENGLPLYYRVFLQVTRKEKEGKKILWVNLDKPYLIGGNILPQIFGTADKPFIQLIIGEKCYTSKPTNCGEKKIYVADSNLLCKLLAGKVGEVDIQKAIHDEKSIPITFGEEEYNKEHAILTKK